MNKRNEAAELLKICSMQLTIPSSDADTISLYVRTLLTALDEDPLGDDDDCRDDDYLIDNLEPFKRCEHFTSQHLKFIVELVTAWLSEYDTLGGTVPHDNQW
jgi:hypothetical protein